MTWNSRTQVVLRSRIHRVSYCHTGSIGHRHKTYSEHENVCQSQACQIECYTVQYCYNGRKTRLDSVWSTLMFYLRSFALLSNNCSLKPVCEFVNNSNLYFLSRYHFEISRMMWRRRELRRTVSGSHCSSSTVECWFHLSLVHLLLGLLSK